VRLLVALFGELTAEQAFSNAGMLLSRNGKSMVWLGGGRGDSTEQQTPGVGSGKLIA
jgi:hypothetical protein